MTRSAHSKRMLSPTLLTRMVGRRGLLRAMSMAVVWLAMLGPMAGRSQDDNPKDHHGVQFAATGKDFWVCFPRSMRGESPNFSRLYAVCERDCDLTIENERLGYSQTVHIMRRRLCGTDTNYIHVPYTSQIARIIDTVPYLYMPGFDYLDYTLRPHIPQYDYSGVLGDRPQSHGFHVTSTDTISLFLVVGDGYWSSTTVIPTEMLRDEYVALPPIATHHVSTIALVPYYITGKSSIDIIAVDDSVTVDIVLSDWDWMNRRPGDTLTVMLRRSELFHVGAGESQEKYYPLLAPYYILGENIDSPEAGFAPVVRHTFAGDTALRDTFCVDLAGTHIKARDCKRIAVYESSGALGIGIRDWGNGQFGMKVDQSLPIWYCGKEFLVPNAGGYLRFLGLEDNTTITIKDMAHLADGERVLAVNANTTNWWEFEEGRGPYYIVADKPIEVKWIGTRSGMNSVIPTRWWHWGEIVYGTPNNVDANGNHYGPSVSGLDIFTYTADVQSMWMDDYRLASYFQPLANTPYSHAHFNRGSSFCSEGTHRIISRTNAPFMAYLSGSYMLNLPHIQPGGTSLTVNGLVADSLSSDSIWCLYDPVYFTATHQRPYDSVIWDFGDSTILRYGHREGDAVLTQQHTYHDTGRYTAMAIFKYADEGCNTRKSDTLWAPLWFHNHYDSTFSVRLCEGSFTFRGHELEYTDTHYVTTYWTPSGCDTLWKIDLVTCPHCHWVYDTVAPEDMPVLFNGITFGAETHDQPIYLHIADTCDSIVYFTLIVIPYWGEKPIDSTWIIAPNVITPTLETNNIFSLRCSHHIQKAEVKVYNRYGVHVAQFDGLAGSWDGTHEGVPCPQGTYVYYIRYMDNHDAAWKTIKGTVTLIR